MKTIVCLGMHRSATSLLAKALHNSGDCFMGKTLLGANGGNPKGYFEDINFIYLNMAILKAAGGSWDNPPAEANILKAGQMFSEHIAKLIELSERPPVWGWKDPRTTLTIRCYMPYLTNPIFMACFRKAEDVAASLTRRDGTSYDKNLDLAKEYNRRLLKFLGEQNAD